MAEPIQPQQMTVPPVSVSGGTAQGPDGKAWATINIQYGLAVQTLVLQPDTAVELADIIPKVLTEAAGHARRANLGLILPGQPDAPHLNGGGR